MKEWSTEIENKNMPEWKTVTVQHEGWTEVFRIYVEDGKVLRGTDKDGLKTTYPYKSVKGGLENASGVRYETFRDGYKTGKYCMR